MVAVVLYSKKKKNYPTYEVKDCAIKLNKIFNKSSNRFNNYTVINLQDVTLDPTKFLSFNL